MSTSELITVYRCEYMLRDLRNNISYSTSSQRGIADFKDGFWVGDDMQFRTGFDCKLWIPPSAIVYIAVESVPKESGGEK